MSDDTLHASFLAEAIPNFWLPQKYLPPRPLPLTKSKISPLSAFLSKLKHSLLACSAAASSPATLLHAARPRLSRKVIHTRPPSSSSSFRVPHAPTTGATPSTQITDPPPNKHRSKPWCMQYSQELKLHLAAEKQIAVARVDEVVMAAIRADP